MVRAKAHFLLSGFLVLIRLPAKNKKVPKSKPSPFNKLSGSTEKTFGRPMMMVKRKISLAQDKLSSHSWLKLHSKSPNNVPVPR